MVAEFQPKVILSTLEKHGVAFVVIGGLAGMAQGSSYPSYDVDIAYGRAYENLERLAGALRELGATLRGAPAGLPFLLDAETLQKGAHFTFATPYGSIDLLSDPDGAPRYDALRSAAVSTEIEGVAVLVASLDHLIAMKEASGRTKDKLMATEYRVLADEIRRPR
ncbi:MAG TPA: hypothetical protein VE644_10370 [Gaiellaceae bacterium]|nr:hypothetical protein [Gaiellaceae bacterium]